MNFSADYTWESVEWQMASRYRNRNGSGGVNGGGWFTDDPLDNWYTDVDDDYETLHVGFDATLDDAKLWRLMADLTWTSGEGRIRTVDVTGGNASGDMDALGFPNTENEWTYFTFEVTRKLSEAWEVGFEYWYEKWEETDWASDSMMTYMGYDDVDPNNSLNALYLGRDYHDYENHIISLLAKFKF